MQTPDSLAARVLDLVGDRAEAQVRVTRTRHGLTRFANSHVHQHVGEDTTAVDLRVARGARLGAATTTRTDAAGLGDLVDRTLAIAAASPEDPLWPGLAGPAAPPRLDHVDAGTAAVTPEERAEVVKAFIDAGEGLNAAGYCETEHLTVAYANSAGQVLTGATTRATLDGIQRTPTSAGQGHDESRRLADLDGHAAGERAARLARLGAEPQDLAPGRYEVVLAPECVGTIAVFLGFYGFNAKTHAEGQSFVRLGERQLDPGFTLTDDVLDPRSFALGFDVEGTPTARTALVEGGTSRALVHDRRTAAAAGTTSTGHAVPGGESYGPVPLALVVGGGTSTHDQLVGEVERGILVTAFNYCRVLDPKTLVVTGLTRNGTYLVEDGEVVRPLANLRFTQSFVAGLAPGAVLGVGRDARWTESEFGAGIAIAPSLRLASWNVTGGAAG